MFFKVATLTQLSEFDEIIDVRTPAEFAEDHLPSARNCPVLDNQERIEIGTLYRQDSPFVARRRGAVLIARNIARQIELHFHDRPKSWRPLMYCWRGGQRSAAMAIIMGQIGWPAHQLASGYKGYRQSVLTQLLALPAQFNWRVLNGPTGSGKTRLLAALAQQGGQVLDLEDLAEHRGSVLGLLPGRLQPGQKAFENRLVQQLRHFSPAQPVYIEAESRTIGRLTLPNSLLSAIQQSRHINLSVPRVERQYFLLQEYAELGQDLALLQDRLSRLQPFCPRQTLQHWQALAQQGQLAQLVDELLASHYDPLYQRAASRHSPPHRRTVELSSLAPATLQQAASVLLQEDQT